MITADLDRQDITKLLALWVSVSGVTSWVLVNLSREFDTFGGHIYVFVKYYDTSPILAIACIFLICGILILFALHQYR